MRVRVLPFDMAMYNFNTARISLCTLLPHLTKLQHFIGSIEISFAAFRLLAQSAGQNMLGIHNLRVKKDEDSPPSHSPAVWTAFKNLRTLEVMYLPGFELDPEIFLDGLAHLHALRVTSFPENIINSLCLMRYDQQLFQFLAAWPASRSHLFNSCHNLTTVELGSLRLDTYLEPFLKRFGPNIANLSWHGFLSIANIFHLCPNMTVLEWSPAKVSPAL